MFKSEQTSCRRVFMLMFFLAISTLFAAMGQKQSNFWYFGKNAGLDFTGFDPLPVSNSQMDSPEGAAAISDSAGKLLFYTDGVNIWNSGHTKINTTGLSGDPSSTQSATIVPDPDTLDQFFVFTTKSFDPGNPDNPGGNFYKIRMKSGEPGSIIYDYSAATGKGGLISKSTEKFAAVPFTYGTNKTGYWFLMHEFGNNRFIKIRYDGVLREPLTQDIGSPHLNSESDDGTNRGAAGQMKVNDQGNRLAVAVEGGKFFELFRFNVNTGLISNPLQIPAGDQDDKFSFTYGAYGVEFSPTGVYGFMPASGNYLYGTTREGGQVFQWDLSFDFDPSQFIKNGRIIYNNKEIPSGALQIAPNGKIYVAFDGQDYLGVIHAPMRTDCKFEQNGVRLLDNDDGSGGLSRLGLPSTIPSQKGPEAFYFVNLCEGDETLFYITNQTIITPNTPRVWIFTKLDGGGGIVTKTSPFNELTYQFPKAGKYRVNLRVFIGGNPVNYYRDLTINPLPVVKLASQDRVPLCLGSSMDLDAGPGAFYEWEDVTIKVRRRTITTDSIYPWMEYRVKVKDYHGCVGWDTIWVDKKIHPTIDTTYSTKAFCGDSNGSAMVVPVGNKNNFNYLWEGYPEKSNTLDSIGPGSYIVHVILKSAPCEVVDTIHVGEIGRSSVRIESSGGDFVCPGEPITLTVTGADEVEWTSHPELMGQTVDIRLDTTTIFTVKAITRDGLRECPVEVTDTIRVFPKPSFDLGDDRSPCEASPIEIDGGEDFATWIWSDGQSGRFARITADADTLVLVATDQYGCVFTDTVGIHFRQGPTVDLGKDIAVCATGQLELNGGTGDSYIWSKVDANPASILGTSQSILVDQTGNYSVTITREGCTRSDTIHVQIDDPDRLRIDTVIHRDITCYGAENGSIEIVATGDGKDFYYSINGGVDYYNNQGYFYNVPPGTGYRVQVLEDSVCTFVYPEPVILSQPDSLLVNYCALPPSCKDCLDGTIEVSVSGGTPPYRISINDSVQDSTFITGLGEGSFILSVTDSLACSFISTVILDHEIRPGIIPDVLQPVCTGIPVTLRVKNTTHIEWINPPDVEDLEIVVLPIVTTTYLARSFVTDANNHSCETLLACTIEVKPFIMPDLGDNINACEGQTVELHAGDYDSWVWSNGMSDRDIVLSTPDQDLIILTVTDSNGCTLEDSVSVNFFPYPEIELGEDQSVCSSDPLPLSGGTGDTYLWSSDAADSIAMTKEIQVAESGVYYLQITSDGCNSKDSVHVRILDPGFFSITSVNPKDISCFGEEDGSLEIEATGSGATFQYSIDGGATYQPSGLFENLSAGEYGQIRVSEDSLCFLDYPEAILIRQPDSIQVSYRLQAPSCETCTDGRLALQISGGRPPYRVTLSGEPVTGLVAGSLGTGTYTLIVTDAGLCTKILGFDLESFKEVPNVITTNGDGVNDLWKIPLLKYYPDAIVRVFTVAGKQVYTSAPGYPVPWNGQENNDGPYLTLGTYYYQIILGPGEGQLTGYLTILR